ncbi:D-alanyl-D-alanine carboxypeptidase family protein [Candidatus Rhodobacter oscarellae]|nr:D-alanyl-D-alanine carboxypeptidase family protein [Candidatus Rhodobacter lobularis]
MVMDARSGKVLHSRNADTRLHPASLTKMMTLYVVFSAVENGEISLDTKVKISKKAAAEQPSKLGLRPGQRIKLRYLIRAAAVKSANDAATALAEAISGSEAAFARRMNRTAKALGMTRSNFKNAHGLTEAGHLSTARDMTILGRHVFYDYPEYYNIFSRRSTHAGIAEVANTNRRFLGAYKGADGIKTGYTRAAGFNLVASAERGQERIITTVFGGRSTAQRNAKVAELMDLGFSRAPSQVAVRKPVKPHVGPGPAEPSKTIRVVRAVAKSVRPMPRPTAEAAEPPQERLIAMAESIDETLSAVQTETVQQEPPKLRTASVIPLPRFKWNKKPSQVNSLTAAMAPQPRPARIVRPTVQTAALEQAPEPERVVVTRLSTSGGRHWSINVGRFTTRYEAERVLLRTALAELGTLDTALRKVASSARGHDAHFVGLTKESAKRACLRLKARNMECTAQGPT